MPPTEATPFLAVDPAQGDAAASQMQSQSEPEPEPQPSWMEILRFSAPLTLPVRVRQRVYILLSLLTVLLSKVAGVLPPLAMKVAIDTIATNVSLPPEDAVSPLTPIFVYFAIQGVSRLIGVVKGILDSLVNKDLNRRMSVRMFDHLHSLSLAYHLEKKSGEVIRVMDRAVGSIVTLMRIAFFSLLPLVFETFLVTAIFYKLGTPWIALSTLLAVVLYTGYTFAVTSVRVKLRRETNAISNKLSDRQVESLTNYETVRSFGRTEDEVEYYGRLSQESQDISMRSEVVLSFLSLGHSFIYMFGNCAGLVIGAYATRWGSPRLSPGEFVMITQYIGQLFGPLLRLSHTFKKVTSALTDLEQAYLILRKKPDIVDSEDAIDLASVSLASRGEVAFENVSFHYKASKGAGAGDGGVSNISFRIPRGRTVALVGASGSGKSTCMRLLLRLYEVDEGRVLIDGHDVRGVTQRSLRHDIGVVSQETILFNDTLRYNITYGKPDATKPEIYAAINAAALGEFIEGLPEKLDTVVGERGMRLSGGERQRVGNARVVIKKPSIILLDEATSALDSGTERKIQDGMQEVCRGRTTVIIAHRLSTITHADEILVLEKGEVKERGAHNELLKRDGLYAGMWRLQTELQRAPQKSIPLDSKAD